MAGIGFEIRKLMDKQTYGADFKAYFFAGIVSSGPWIISILCVGLLWVFSAPYMGMPLQKLFRVVVVHTYAYSLITTGIIQFILNRYLSDKLFLKQGNLFLPTYIAVVITTVVSQGILGMIFYSFSPVDLQFKVSGILLFIAISCIWQTMIFLSSSRDYIAIMGAFFWGNIISLSVAMLLGRQIGFNGYLSGYTVGQISILFFLVYRIFREFDSAVLCNFDFLRYVKKYFDLFLIGIFYYSAIWVDKIIYWYSPSGQKIYGLFRSHYPYDSCMFLAFLTLVPALTHFMIDVETNFYNSYKSFYGAIVNKGNFDAISQKKKGMLKGLLGASGRMIMLQTVVTGAFLCYAPDLINFLRLDQAHLRVFWAAGIGTYCQVFVLLCLILILYFDRRRIALIVALFFLVTNASLTFLVIKFYPQAMGFGYAASTFLTAIVALCLLVTNARQIEYATFVEQPLKKPKLPKVTTRKIG